MSDVEISIPHDWSPRPHQLPFFRAMDGGKTRACLVWHRRAGKDSSVLNFTAKEMFRRVGNYWHLFPKQTQARKAIWNGIDGEGRRIIKQLFPKQIVSKQNGTDMIIEVANGSTWQLCGSDNYDNLVGANPVGVVFSEWSLCDPNAWNYVRPMLAENGGWAVFIYTPRGKNHGHTLYNMARKNPNWHCELLTVDDTKRADGSPVIGSDIIQAERDEGMSEEKLQQEYYCSFDAQIEGAILGDQMRNAYNQKRINLFPIDPALPVGTSWDLGHRDATTIWFWQAVAGEIRLVNYHEENMKPLSYFINYVKEWCGDNGVNYRIGKHFLPHDCDAMRLGQNETVRQQMAKEGFTCIATERPKTKQVGIEAVRQIMPKLWIHEDNCAQGIACLSEYQYEWDDKKKMFKEQPLHNWASHGFDGLQTLALGWKESFKGGYTPPKQGKMKVAINVF